MITVSRSKIKIQANPQKVVARYLKYSVEGRIRRIVSAVMATLEIPLLEADTTEREGYVPNVVYTCGVLKHLDNLIIPYAMSDSAIGFARVGVQEIIDELLNR